MLKRFQPTLVENPFERLLGPKQDGLVREFREQFEVLSGPLKITQPEYLCGIFANGLTEEIRVEVRLNQPRTLKEVMDLTLLVDERNEVYGRGS